MAIKLSGLVSNMDTDSIVKQLMSAQRLKATKIENKKTTTEWKQDIWKDLNSKIYSFYTGTLSKVKLQSSYNTNKVTSSDENNATVTAGSSATTGTHTLKISQLASAQNVTGAVVDSGVTGTTNLSSLGYAVGDKISVKVGSKTTTLDITETSTVNDVVSKLKSGGVNASFDATQKRFFISSKQSGSANAFELTSSNTTALAKLGLNSIELDADSVPFATGTASMTLNAPKDAKFVYNGVEMTSSSNLVNVNGLSITLKSVTDGSDTASESDDEVINLNITNDTSATYDMVKGFIKEYNDILKQMNTYYDADPAKGYDPLTDDQKEAMSDSEVEKWEAKIKDSLLRRDDNLGSLINTMRTSMNGVVKVDGKSYSLSSFGISSVSYTENGLLHINGDEDDSLVSGEDKDLMKALEENPDKVAQVLSGLATNLYSKFSEGMKSSSLRSVLTLYNDKEIKKQIDGYTDDLATFEDKMNDMEERYNKQFTAMETAMSKMNSQSSSLSAMLGTSS
jgi:flagellar hook-associated protein 2